MGSPPDPPSMLLFWNQMASMATAKARVTMATKRPRMRRAGSPTTTPTTVATRDARIGAIGNGTPHECPMVLRANPATPARASWASEICPT